MEIALASLVLLLLMFAGMPIVFSFLTGSLFYMVMTGTSMGDVVSAVFFSLNNYTILTLPLFIIAGALMDVSGIAEQLIEFSRVLLKRIKGGMGAVIPVSSMFFGAISGSGTATVAAMSKILLPKLEKLGWDKRYTAALVAASGPLGYMIPPNINAILYGVVANTSIAALFLATIIPGIIWGVLYIIINRFVYAKWYKPVDVSAAAPDGTVTNGLAANRFGLVQGVPAADGSYFRELYAAFKPAIPAFVMPVIIFGGIYGGFFTATEAGAVSCIYALLAGIFIFKTIKLSNTLSAFRETGEMLGAILIILPMIDVFTRLLVLEGVPAMVAEGLSSISTNKHVVLFLIILILLIAGLALEAPVLIFVFGPLLLPTIQAIDVHPIQFGVILFVSIGIGALSPPVAMNLFIAAKASGVSMEDLMKPLLPYLFFGALPVLLLVTYVPELSLWLPKVVMGLKL